MNSAYLAAKVESRSMAPKERYSKLAWSWIYRSPIIDAGTLPRFVGRKRWLMDFESWHDTEPGRIPVRLRPRGRHLPLDWRLQRAEWCVQRQRPRERKPVARVRLVLPTRPPAFFSTAKILGQSIRKSIIQYRQRTQTPKSTFMPTTAVQLQLGSF
jgi:hypothetical protein